MCEQGSFFTSSYCTLLNLNPNPYSSRCRVFKREILYHSILNVAVASSTAGLVLNGPLLCNKRVHGTNIMLHMHRITKYFMYITYSL